MCFALSHPCGLKVTAACFFPWHPQQFPDDVNHHATSPVFSVILSLLSVVVPFWFQRLQNCQAESRRIAASRRLEQCLPFILPLLLFSPLVLLHSSPLSRISLSSCFCPWAPVPSHCVSLSPLPLLHLFRCPSLPPPGLPSVPFNIFKLPSPSCLTFLCVPQSIHEASLKRAANYSILLPNNSIYVHLIVVTSVYPSVKLQFWMPVLAYNYIK